MSHTDSTGSTSSGGSSVGTGTVGGPAGPPASPTARVKPTSYQAADLKDAFHLLDQDGNGYITKKRLAILLAELDRDVDLAGLKDVLVALEVDKTDKIDIQHFLSIVARTSDNIDPDESVRDAFQMFDRGNHGYISVTDIQRVMGSIGETPTRAEAAKMIQGADQNGDGTVNLKEFTRLMKQ